MAEELVEETGAEETRLETEDNSSDTATLAQTGVPSNDEALDQTADDGDEGASSDTNWPDDWRDVMSGGDDKIKSLLNRYTSPAAAAKAFRDLRVAYDTRETKKPQEDVDLPDDPTEEQLAAYRKAKGVPETPDDYEFEVPEGRDLSDEDVTILNDFAAAMHERNMPANVVRDISGWFLEYEEAVQQQRAEVAYNTRIQTEEKLRAEWGPDFRGNVNLMSNILQEHLGASSDDFLSTPLADGSRIGDNENFIRLMADLARKVGGSTADLYTTDVQTTGKGLEERKSELMKMMNDPDPQVRKKYWAADTQAELQRIQTAITRRAS
jgi:hypothetical protein